MRNGLHGNTVKAKIRKLDRDVVSEVITVAAYQRELRGLLSQIPDLFVRMHYENMALLPLETRH